MSRALRVGAGLAVVLLAGVGLYAAAGYWLVPRVLVSQVETLVDEELSLEAKAADVSFDPFGLRLEVRGFAMGLPGEAPSASFDELVVDVDFLPLLAGGVVVDELHLGAPMLALRVDESGELRIAGARLGDGTPDPEPESVGDAAGEGDGAPITQLLIRQLGVSSGTFRLDDHGRKPAVERDFGPIEFHAEDVDLLGLLAVVEDLREDGSAELEVTLGDGATLSARGDVRVHPLRLDLTVHVAALPLAWFSPYVSPFAALEVRDGQLEVKGRLRTGLRAAAPQGLHFEGSLRVSDFDVAEPGEDQPIIAWKALDIADVELATDPLTLGFGSLNLAEPSLRLLLTAEGLNLSRAFAAESAAKSGPQADVGPPAGEVPVVVLVGPMKVSKGSLRFEDYTIDPAYHIELADLVVSVDGFSTDPAARSQLELSTRADGYAPVELRGSIAPLSPLEFLDLSFVAKNLELTSLSGYSGRFVGNEIRGGRGSAKVDVKIAKHTLVSDNRLVLDGLAFGDVVESSDATSLPVTTAAVLMADANGRIEIDLPVAGNLEDPDFSYQAALLDALRTLVTRVVWTPFKLVGGMVSLGGKLFRPDELEVVAFAAGSDDLDGDAPLKLDALAKTLEDNPKLVVEVRGAADPALDGEDELRALARRRTREVREYLEDAGIDEERLLVGEVQIGRQESAEEGQERRVLTHLELR